MTREEIKKIGLEAGIRGMLVYPSQHAFGLSTEDAWQQFERFAALVAAAEREECAVLADTMLDWYEIAAAIRARGQE